MGSHDNHLISPLILIDFTLIFVIMVFILSALLYHLVYANLFDLFSLS